MNRPKHVQSILHWAYFPSTIAHEYIRASNFVIENIPIRCAYDKTNFSTLPRVYAPLSNIFIHKIAYIRTIDDAANINFHRHSAISIAADKAMHTHECVNER